VAENQRHLYQPSKTLTLEGHLLTSWRRDSGIFDSGADLSAAIRIRRDFDAAALRRLATTVKDAGQARRLLALAAVYDGKDREEAARIGGMDRQTLRDWVHRFNQCGPDGLINAKSPGRRPKLSKEQMEELGRLVEAGPDLEKDGFARWRCVDLKRVLGARFAVDLSEVSLGRVLRKLGFSHISARPRHPKQDPEAVASFKKKFSGPRVGDREPTCIGNVD
jgi:transposase